jgi:hypothetical protein
VIHLPTGSALDRPHRCPRSQFDAQTASVCTEHLPKPLASVALSGPIGSRFRGDYSR